jgi:hypothetical protein
MNQHYFDVPFAFAGDVTPIPDPLQTGGTVSFTEGWNFNYQRDLSTDPAAEPIDRSTMNWLLLQITQALQAIQNAGVPEFITAAQNGGASFPYGKGTPVLWSASGNAPFGKYVSLTAGNTNTPSASDPQGLTTGWQLVVDPIATAAQAAAGTDDASIMTPLKVAQQTALRALIAGNASQVFNVAPAVSTTQAPQFSQLTSVIGDARNLQCIHTTAGNTATWAAQDLNVEAPGLRYTIANFNATLDITKNGAGGMDTGGISATGFVAAYAIYNPTTGVSNVLGVNVTSAGSISETYAGSFMPSGFTASALIGVVPTASSTLAPFFQRGRSVSIISIAILSTGAIFPFSGFAVSVIPVNCKSISGVMSLQNAGASGNTTIGIALFEGVVSMGSKSISFTGTPGTTGASAPFEKLKIFNPNTFYAGTTTSGSGGGTPNFTVTLNGYEF